MAFHGKRILMLETLKRLFGRMVEGEISIPEILEKISNKADLFKGMWHTANEAIAPFVPAFIVALLLVVLALCEAYFGKRLFGVQKVAACFALGFIAGATYLQPFLAPLVANFFALDKIVVGLVVGVIAALLCRPIYFCGYVGVIGYFGYFLMMSGALLEFTKGSKMIGIIVAAGLITLALMFRKIVEIAGTSLLGAFFTYEAVDYAVSTLAGGARFADFLGANEIYVKLAAIGVIAISGFIVQYVTRKRW